MIQFADVLVDGADLWTVRQGRGPFLVLCHGGPGMWDYLGPVADLVDDLVTAVRYDQRACGRSSGDSSYDIRSAVADLEALRVHFGVVRWVVGGHSFGASLALAYCLEHPTRVAGLIYLAGTGIDPGWHTAYRANRAARLGPDGLRRFEELRGRVARAEGEERREAERAYSLLYRSTDLADPARAELVEQMLETDRFRPNQEVNRVLGADAATRLEDPAIRRRIERLAVPALIVHGDADPRPLSSARQLADALPNARLAALPDCGHFPWIEQPEAFQVVLREFLQRWSWKEPRAEGA